MPGTPSLADVIDSAIKSRLRDVHTALPGKVVKYSRTTHTAEVTIGVQFTVERADGSQLLEEVPPIKNVPVAWPHGASGSSGSNRFYIEFPLPEGIEGLLVFSESAWGHFREYGQLSPPGDLRRHSLSYCAFVPCGLINDDEYEDGGQQGLIIVPDERHLSVRRAGDSDDWVALAGLVLDELQAIKDYVDAHVHTSAAAGSPTSPPTVPMPAPSSVACGTLKAGPS